MRLITIVLILVALTAGISCTPKVPAAAIDEIYQMSNKPDINKLARIVDVVDKDYLRIRIEMKTLAEAKGDLEYYYKVAEPLTQTIIEEIVKILDKYKTVKDIGISAWVSLDANKNVLLGTNVYNANGKEALGFSRYTGK